MRQISNITAFRALNILRSHLLTISYCSFFSYMSSLLWYKFPMQTKSCACEGPRSYSFPSEAERETFLAADVYSVPACSFTRFCANLCPARLQKPESPSLNLAASKDVTEVEGVAKFTKEELVKIIQLFNKS